MPDDIATTDHDRRAAKSTVPAARPRDLTEITVSSGDIAIRHPDQAKPLSTADPDDTATRHRDQPDPAPAALAIDLGSATVGIWAAHRGTVSAPSQDVLPSTRTAVRRGRIVDADNCITLLTRLAHRYPQPIPTAGVVVACQPVGTGEAEQAQLRTVIDAAFAPTRVMFIDSVRAAAIGTGAAAGALLIVDIGAELTETALLRQGRIITARRADIGTRDLDRGATVDLIGDIIVRHLEYMHTGSTAKEFTTATKRGLLLVGDGATHPALPPALSRASGLRVHRAAAPRTTALNGAGLAAMSALRHPAFSRSEA